MKLVKNGKELIHGTITEIIAKAKTLDNANGLKVTADNGNDLNYPVANWVSGEPAADAKTEKVEDKVERKQPEDLFEQAVKAEVITKSSGWYKLGDETLGREDDARSWVAENKQTIQDKL